MRTASQILCQKEDSHYWGEVPANLRAIDIWIGEASDLGKSLHRTNPFVFEDQLFLFFGSVFYRYDQFKAGPDFIYRTNFDVNKTIA